MFTDGWASEATQAVTFFERFRGLRGQANDARLLIQTSSIHTIGMTRSIGLVLIGPDRRVIRVQTLAPNRLIRERAARFILELPEGAAVPEEGAQVEVVDA